MTETNATVSGGFPPGRYGRRREPRRGPAWLRPLPVLGLSLAVVAIGTVAAVVLAQSYGPGRPYDATVHRFYDVTDHQVVVEFTVVVPEGETAVCAVRARDADGAEVGREELRVRPPSGETRPTVVHTLPTTARPVTGEVQRCWRGG